MYPSVRRACSPNPNPQPPHALPAFNDTAPLASFPPDASKSRKLSGSVRVVILMTPPSAPLPYRSDVAPLKICVLSTLTRGTRFQYTQPPNGLFRGTPSYITSARLAPFAPTPRNETPCDVGLAVRPPERRNNENPGACRNTSSIVNAPDNAISRLPSASSLVGAAGIRSSSAVTTMRSIIAAGSSRICSGSLDPGPSSFILTALKPAACTVNIPCALVVNNANSPCSSVRVRATPVLVSNSTDACEITAPLGSETTPAILVCGC